MESLTALVLVSVMLMMYLPSFYTELNRLRDMEQRTKQWQVFSELVEIELSEKLPSKAKEQEKTTRLERYAQLSGEQILEFFCSSSQCMIRFEGGNEFYEAWE